MIQPFFFCLFCPSVSSWRARRCLISLLYAIPRPRLSNTGSGNTHSMELNNHKTQRKHYVSPKEEQTGSSEARERGTSSYHMTVP